jgi:ribonuclease P protein component
MLPKKYRLAREKDIRAALRRGRLIRGDSMDLKYLKSGLEAPRFLFLISAKTAKKAHERNKIKRILAEATCPIMPKIENYDCAFIAKKNIIGKNQPQVAGEIRDLFGRAGLLDG